MDLGEQIYQERMQIFTELLHMLDQERIAVVEANVDALVQINLQKENAIRLLRRNKAHEQALRAKNLPFPKSTEGTELWERVKKRCEENQLFLQHSVRNLNQMVENWKQIVGERPAYGPAGTYRESKVSGKMVERNY